MNVELQWQEHDLDGVVRYFANGFTPPKGQKIISYEFRIDTHLRKVVFKLTVENEVQIRPLTKP